MSRTDAPSEECPACGSQSILYRGNLDAWICENCSYVVEETESRSSIPNLRTDFDEEDGRDRRWDHSIPVKDKSEANLIDVLQQVDKLADNLGVNDNLGIRAAEISVEAWKINFMHGRSKSGTVGASMYAASREMQHGIPPQFIADQIESDRKSLKSTYRKLKSELNLAVVPPSPTEYISHICNHLDLTDSVEKEAKGELADYRGGGNPVGVAAAGVYLSANQSGYDLTLRTVSRAVGLTKETIWRHSENIREIVSQQS